jgi:hypothetical protein
MLELKKNLSGRRSSEDTLATVVGSVAAIIGALGVTAFAANTAPIVAVSITAASTAVAAGALYLKLAEKRRHERLTAIED